MKTATKIAGMAKAAVALSLLLSVAAEAKVNRVTVTAEVPVVDGDKQRTLEAAKRAARREAVEQGAGTLVESNTIVRNYQLIADEIVTTARGILTDEEWGELQMGDGTAKITLTASVSQEAIEKSICTVVKANHDPKISLVFVEKTGKEHADWKIERGLIEALFTEKLMDACFTMVEPAVKVTQVSATGDIPQEVIDDIVKRTNAQYIMLGSGKFIESDVSGSLLGDTQMKSYSLSANVRLINTSTNVIEAVGGKSAQVIGISPEHAMKGNREKAYGMIDDVIDQIFDKISKRWSDELVNSASVQVIVQNVKNYAASRSFQKTAEKAFPRGKVESRGLKRGQAVFEIDVEGGADEFAAQMEGKKIGKFSVEVLEVTRGKVVLQLN